MKTKDIHVVAYTRRRNGQLEYVCSHFRSSPNR